MIETKVYDELKKKFKDVASWAIWSTEDLQAGQKLHTGDMSVFDNPNLLDIIHSNFVFVGLNASVHAPRKDGYTGSWRMFHSDDNENQQDYKMRYAFKDTLFWGAYMTDLIKDHPEASSEKVKEYIKDNPEILTRNIKVLREELEILGAKPILIALGRCTETYLNRHLKGEYTILYLNHYSDRIGDETLRDKTLKLIEENDLK